MLRTGVVLSWRSTLAVNGRTFPRSLRMIAWAASCRWEVSRLAAEIEQDVIVIGGGMAGCAAAVSAARAGCQTLLIESFGFLGGWATAALVNPFMSHCAADGKALVGGLYEHIRERLRSAGGLLANSFDSEAMKFVLQEMVIESGAGLRLHTFLERARVRGDGSIAVRLRSKTGVEEIGCRRLVDCSGDGDAAVSLGARYEMGDAEGLPQAVTLMFDMGGVDFARAMAYVRDHPDQFRFPKLPTDADPVKLAEGVISVAGYYDLVAEARAKGEYEAAGDLIFYIGRPQRGTVVFNTTHIGDVDGANADDLTRAEIEGRRQMMSIVGFVRKYVPGFEESYLLQSAAHVGVRETRRIIGEYLFSEDDVIEARKFDDAICRLAYPVDVHSGRGSGYTKSEEEEDRRRARPNAPPRGDWYEVPYRCLVPLGVEDLLVAGRCVSSTQAGHGAIRIMPCCAAMGEAAGTAAAMSLRDGIAPRRVDGTAVRDALRARGALL